MSKTKKDLLTYAVIGAAATPIAMAKGEFPAAIFVIAAISVLFFFKTFVK